jgi:carboxypeptidase C (cathepsin A)
MLSGGGVGVSSSSRRCTPVAGGDSGPCCAGDPLSDDTTRAETRPDAEVAKRQREVVDRLLAGAPAVSDGTITLGGVQHDYTVHAAFVPVPASGLAAAAAPAQAAVFTTAYLRKGSEPGDRPVCFAFNGGPGSASLWLHLGASHSLLRS